MKAFIPVMLILFAVALYGEGQNCSRYDWNYKPVNPSVFPNIFKLSGNELERQVRSKKQLKYEKFKDGTDSILFVIDKDKYNARISRLPTSTVDSIVLGDRPPTQRPTKKNPFPHNGGYTRFIIQLGKKTDFYCMFQRMLSKNAVCEVELAYGVKDDRNPELDASNLIWATTVCKKESKIGQIYVTEVITSDFKVFELTDKAELKPKNCLIVKFAK